MEMLAKMVKSKDEFDHAVNDLRKFLNDRGCVVLVAYLDVRFINGGF